MKLATRASLALAFLFVVMALLLFLAAGTVRYWQAWLYLLVFIGASTLITLELLQRDPALLERRMRGGARAEKRPAQRVAMFSASLGFIAVLVVPAFDHRFGWCRVPLILILLGELLVVLGMALIRRVYRENTFTSATIELAENQRVISTGPYAIVRHPMYAGGALYLFGTPLALGSYWGFVAIAAMMPFLIWRLVDEERFLAEKLPGYAAYQAKVKRRLVPFLW